MPAYIAKKNATKKPVGRSVAKPRVIELDDDTETGKGKNVKTTTKKTSKKKFESFTVELVFAKETSGTYLYKETDSDGDIIEDMRETKIGNLYIRKSNVPDGNYPERISVTVEVA